MGAWGEGPFDNDTAADWFFELEKIGLFDLIERGLNSGSYDEVRAAAWLYAKLSESAYIYNVNCIDQHAELAICKLEDILADNDWLDNWADRSLVEKSIKEQIDDIKKPPKPGLMSKIADTLGVTDEDS